MQRLLKRFLTPPLVLVVAFFIFLEELLWDDLARWIGKLAALPFWAALERWIAGLPPVYALLLYLLPVLGLLPFKIGALFLLAHGHVGTGVLVIVAAKITGTAIAARLFLLTKPALLSVAWFRRLYERFVAVKEWAYAFVKATHSYRQIRQTARAIRLFFARERRKLRDSHWLARRWYGLRRKLARKRYTNSR